MREQRRASDTCGEDQLAASRSLDGGDDTPGLAMVPAMVLHVRAVGSRPNLFHPGGLREPRSDAQAGQGSKPILPTARKTWEHAGLRSPMLGLTAISNGGPVHRVKCLSTKRRQWWPACGPKAIGSTTDPLRDKANQPQGRPRARGWREDYQGPQR